MDSLSNDERAATADDAQARVEKDVAHIRLFVSGLSLDDVKSGDWFAKLLAFSLHQYANQADAAYFSEKYPNLPPDAVVDSRIAMAANYAAIEGALSSAA